VSEQIAIVGGGPAGLSAALALAAAGFRHVTIHEREQHAGGIPRHTHHQGFGLRDLHRVMSGPAYARRLVAAAERAGVEIRTGSPVFERPDADVVLLATGVRERPRAARLIPGDRPAGLFTTGSLQQLAGQQSRRVGRTAVIVGAEHVSFSAIWTLRSLHCRPLALVTEHPHHQTTAALRLATAIAHRVPLITGRRVAGIDGRGRVEAVVLDDGTRLACDTVVFTGDWVPDHELARHIGLAVELGSKAPTIGADFRTSSRGVFAIGNLVHPAETADVCALDGRRVAGAVAEYLRTERWPDVTPIVAEPPLRWASYAAGWLTVRTTDRVVGRLALTDAAGGIHHGRLRRMMPNRAAHVRVPKGVVVRSVSVL
jgi:thioredoxin reductase